MFFALNRYGFFLKQSVERKPLKRGNLAIVKVLDIVVDILANRVEVKGVHSVGLGS